MNNIFTTDWSSSSFSLPLAQGSNLSSASVSANSTPASSVYIPDPDLFGHDCPLEADSPTELFLSPDSPDLLFRNKVSYLESPLAPSSTMRTVYLGGLSPDLTLEEILNNIKGGLIEQVKYFPERNCCFITFLDANVAASLFSEAQTRRFLIGGCDVKVGWGKQSNIPPAIINAVMNGATRNVFIGNIDETVTEDFLRSEFGQFGMVDHVKILYEKRIAFVHMAGIAQAMKAVSTLQLDPSWMSRRVHYGRDRCAPNGLNPLASLPPSLIGSHLLKNGDPNTLLAPLNSPGNIPNRTIYIGGIHPEVTTRDICDTIRGGILQHVKYMAEKNIAFITFVEAECAVQFYDRCQQEGLVFKGKRVKVGWGKATPLPTSVQIAVQNSSASRNVYIGSIDDSITEEKLSQDFGEFGEIELINIIPDKNIAFVNFTDILSAIRAVEVMKNNPEYHRFKVNYGKDRCGNGPRFSSIQSGFYDSSIFSSSQVNLSSEHIESPLPLNPFQVTNSQTGSPNPNYNILDNLASAPFNAWGNQSTLSSPGKDSSKYTSMKNELPLYGRSKTPSLLDDEYSTILSGLSKYSLNTSSSNQGAEIPFISRSNTASPSASIWSQQTPIGASSGLNRIMSPLKSHFERTASPVPW